jgi:L-cysteine/cystine lyase
VSHILWGTSQILQLDRLARVAATNGALLLADGAQSAGAIAVDPAALGVDLYTASGQKWVCGPSGTGALWVREGLEVGLGLGQPGYLSRDFHGEGMPLWPGARRLDGASLAPASLRGLAESVRFRREVVGWEAGFEHAVELAGRARAMLRELPRVEVDEPPGPLATLITFSIDGVDAKDANIALERAGVLARHIERPRRVRISVGFWTSDADLERLAGAIRAI